MRLIFLTVNKLPDIINNTYNKKLQRECFG